jgi:gamma-glutamylcyclotransferase (GGCT)/AIG2-like uncharacterized protein YtfP
MSNQIEKLPFFFYGTLKTRPKLWSRKVSAKLKGYAMYQLENNWFPGILPHVLGTVRGYLYHYLSDDESFTRVVRGMDGYEGAPYLYTRKVVEVATRAGKVRVYAYIFNDPKDFRHGRRLVRVKGGRWKK